ncbi:MAG: HAMP domain-containing sensor histidine kinase [Pseudolabrys sp.]|jgi:signal transduction histidine kinase
MSNLTLASVNPALDRPPAAQWVHDIRNALAVAGLHLETLGRLSGPQGRKAADATAAVMKRAARMCDDSLAVARQPGRGVPRRGFDLIGTINEVVAILAPLAPAGFRFETPPESRCMVVADPGDVYRVLFNLAGNAVTVARGGGALSRVSIGISCHASAVAVSIADDGPGLPDSVRADLFRRHRRTTNGLGIAIARELMEQNGGTLRLAPTVTGTTFVFELPCLRAVTGTRGHAKALDFASI